MYIFIDESGIHKAEGHSTVVIVYVVVDQYELLAEKLLQIHKSLGIRTFHWSDFGSRSGWRVREQFIIAISHLQFSCKVAIINNPIHLPNDIDTALEYLLIERKFKKIVFDGKKPRWYERQLKHVLRTKGISTTKLKTAQEQSEPVLCIADALAGLFRVHIDNPSDTTQRLIRKIKNKITAQLGGQDFR